MGQIKLGPAFFRKERDNLYSDFVSAFWREMLQNSMDAGASRIRIFLSENGEGTRVIFEDNGIGMDRKTVEEVFFALGETTKDENSGGVGGFGRARILTCFAMDSYNFRTQNLFVKGQASEYEIEEVDQFYRGCKFVIEIADKGNAEMRSALDNVLKMSQIDSCEVFVNDERWKDWMHRLRLTREIKCGGVYVNKSKPSNSRIIVRVKGLYMFDMHTFARQQVIVEIDPKNSRSILTVNRDGMHYAYQNNLNQFLAEIAIDKSSALRSRKRQTVLLEGRGIIVTSSKTKKEVLGLKKDDAALEEAVASNIGSSISKVFEFNMVTVGPKPVLTAEEKIEEIVGDNGLVAPASRAVDEVKREIVPGDKYVSDLPSIYINDETSNPKVIKMMPYYDPRNWVHAIKNTKGVQQSYRKGSTYLKVLLCWKAACEEAVNALLRSRNLESVSWLVGWIFCDESEASHVVVSGAHALCLNPVDSSGLLKYAIHNRNDMRAMMAFAKHEAAHIVARYHDEDFSTVHTQIDKNFDPSSALRAMKAAIASVK